MSGQTSYGKSLSRPSSTTLMTGHPPVGDAQRFGFELQSLMLIARPAGLASATITLRVPTSVEGHVVAARLSRHPALQRVDACADAGKIDLDNTQAAAA